MIHGTIQEPLFELYRFVFDQAPDAMVVFDAEGRILVANGAARELPRDLLEGTVSPGHVRPELEPFREQLRSQGQAQVEVRVSGRAIVIDGRAHAACWVVSFRDETERRRLEAELGALRRVESVGHFTATLIHDFNNLLTPIACLSSCLEADLPPGDDNRELAREIRTAAEKAAALARQTLRWVRREPPRAEAVDLGVVLTEVAPLVERVVGVEIKVDVSAAPNVGAATLDRDRLEHAILNLAANARDAMPSGGRLSLSATRVSFDEGEAVAVEGTCSGGYVALRVADTGIGMKSEVRERIFEPFFTTKEAGRGTGLGLEGVRRFVSESGGCIAVQSREGRGTTVSLYFPVVDLVSPAPTTPRSMEPRGSGTVLVVDDDDRVRSAMAAVLELHGYRVLPAANAEQAIEAIRRREPPVDLVVVDVIMPGMGGLALSRELRELGASRVLFTSGHTEDRLERSGLRPEDGPLLRKAFTPSELLESVRKLMGTPGSSQTDP